MASASSAGLAGTAVVPAVLSLGGVVALTALEFLVAFLQAFVQNTFTDNVTIKRGKRSKVKVEQLPDTAPQQQHDLTDRAAKAIAAFDALGTTQADLEQHIGRPVSEWTPDDLQQLMGLYAQKNTPAVDTTNGEVIEEQA